MLCFWQCPIAGCAVIDAQRFPTKSPKRFSASPGLQKPRSISVLILCCVAGRAIEATQASHPDSISMSVGKLATLTKLLVSMSVCLSKDAIHMAVALGQVAWDVVSAENYFKGATSSHEARQSRHWAATRHQSGANFKLRQDGFLATCEPHVAGESKLTSHAGCPPAN